MNQIWTKCLRYENNSDMPIQALCTKNISRQIYTVHFISVFINSKQFLGSKELIKKIFEVDYYWSLTSKASKIADNSVLRQSPPFKHNFKSYCKAKRDFRRIKSRQNLEKQFLKENIFAWNCL